VGLEPRLGIERAHPHEEAVEHRLWFESSRVFGCSPTLRRPSTVVRLKMKKSTPKNVTVRFVTRYDVTGHNSRNNQPRRGACVWVHSMSSRFSDIEQVFVGPGA
jgi:hypothetical protein